MLLFVLAGLPLVLAGCAVVANRLYVPPEIDQARVDKTETAATGPSTRLSLVTWNIGYAGMGKESDFLLDKGTQLRPLSPALVDRNLAAISAELPRLDADVFLLQEVAKPSWSSYRRDVLAKVIQTLPGYDHMFGADINTRFVPPPYNVRIGNAIFSRRTIASAERRALPLEPTFTWGIFRKGYRMHIARIGGSSGWVIINLHLSTFDSAEDNVRERQVNQVIRFAEAEYRRGAHVVVGGDWNLKLADTSFPHTTEPKFLFWIRDFPTNKVPLGWNWAVDPTVPSVRTAQKPYVAGENHTLIIDGFLVSPNVEIEGVRGVDLGFEYSDHNPVRVEVKMR